MRTIEFRGICNEEVHTHHEATEIGEWIYGYLVDKNHIRIPMSEEHGGIGSGVVYVDVEVLPETVGQFTMSKDINGKKIFEGDLLKTTRTKSWRVETPDYDIVVWNDNGWKRESYNGQFKVYPDINYKEMEIIGNIHDH